MKLSYRRMSALLVDSYTASLDALESALEPLELFRLWRARGAEEALKALRSRQVDLVIAAAKLQPVSGLTLLQMIRADERLRDLPVLLTLDRKDAAGQEKAHAAGVTQLVSLPLEPAECLQAVEQALEPFIDPLEEEFLQQMAGARQAMRAGDLDAAEKAYRAALAVKVDEDAQVSLARLLQAKGDMRGAEHYFMAALKANPICLRAILGLASVYQTTGRLEQALQLLAGAVAAARKLKSSGEVKASIFFYIGEIELQLQRLQEALGIFQQACESSPHDPKLPAKIGDTLAQAGYMAESEEFYKRALELDPELAHVYNRLAIAYRRQGKLELALNLYRKALHFHPGDENLLYNMARCYWEMNDDQCAVDQLTKALKINPGFTEATTLLDALFTRMGFKPKTKAKVQGEAAAGAKTGAQADTKDEPQDKTPAEPRAAPKDKA